MSTPRDLVFIAACVVAIVIDIAAGRIARARLERNGERVRAAIRRDGVQAWEPTSFRPAAAVLAVTSFTTVAIALLAAWLMWTA